MKLILRRSFLISLSLTLISGLTTISDLSAFAAGEELIDPHSPDLGPEERFQALADQIHHAQSQLRSLEARFVQRKESNLLLEPEVSEGTFAFVAPDRVRWDFTIPSDTVVVVRGQEMLTWYRDLKRAERVQVGPQADRMLQFLGPGSSLATLQRYFSVSAAFPKDTELPYRLELKPRISRLGKRIRKMTLHIDPRLFVPVRVSYEEPGGQITELSFEDLEINAEINSERFQPTLPDDVEVRTVDLGG